MGMPIRLRWYSMQLNIPYKKCRQRAQRLIAGLFQPMGEGWGRGWGGSAAQQIDKIGRIACQHQNAGGTGELFFSGYAEQQQDSGQGGHNGVHQEVGGKDNRRNQGGCAHHEENIEDIAAHNVTNGDVRLAPPGQR